MKKKEEKIKRKQTNQIYILYIYNEKYDDFYNI